ncbi:MAG: hypothetical protein ACI4JC_08885 [Faecalibacterium sp.]
MTPEEKARKGYEITEEQQSRQTNGISIERFLRKKQSELILSGIGAILLGLWAFIKVILSILLAADYVDRVFGFDSEVPELKPITLFLWMILGLANMILYSYVGTRAMREGRTGKQQRGYLVLAAVLLSVNVLLFILNLMYFPGVEADILDLIGELLQESARAATFGAMLRAAHQTRKLSINKEQETVGHAN